LVFGCGLEAKIGFGGTGTLVSVELVLDFVVTTSFGFAGVA
jgi:hypothetical protein